jgi:hypothetical protein
MKRKEKRKPLGTASRVKKTCLELEAKANDTRVKATKARSCNILSSEKWRTNPRTRTLLDEEKEKKKEKV